MQTNATYPFEKDVPDIRDISSVRPYSTYNSRISQFPPLHAIVAMGKDRSIGINGDMPWHIPADLKHFKALTMGHPVIMGRRTWLSLPKRPLPGRLNVVLSRSEDFSAEGAQMADSLEKALMLCASQPAPFIIGGGTLYLQALPFVDTVYVTLIDADFPDADTFFPELPEEEWLLKETEGPFETPAGLSFRFQTFVRK